MKFGELFSLGILGGGFLPRAGHFGCGFADVGRGGLIAPMWCDLGHGFYRERPQHFTPHQASILRLLTKDFSRSLVKISRQICKLCVPWPLAKFPCQSLGKIQVYCREASDEGFQPTIGQNYELLAQLPVIIISQTPHRIPCQIPY